MSKAQKRGESMAMADQSEAPKSSPKKARPQGEDKGRPSSEQASMAPSSKGSKPAKGDTPCSDPASHPQSFDESKLTLGGKPLKNGCRPTGKMS